MNTKFIVIVALIFSVSTSFAKSALTNKDIALCAIFQNEAPYLKEWIEFYKLIGVKHFYLYNNLSTDNFDKVLKPYVKSGIVTLKNWDYRTNPDGNNWTTIQIMAYMHALELAKQRYKWLIFVDTDEYLFPVQVDTLSEFLSDYEEAGSVCVNWQMYGTSGVRRIAPGHLLIEDLIYKAQTLYPENSQVKCIVRPEYVQQIVSPHFCILQPGFPQMNANRDIIDGPWAPINIDKIRINHYWTRDEYFFYRKKIPRRKVWQDNSSLERANNLNYEVDTAIFKYVQRLKKAITNAPR